MRTSKQVPNLSAGSGSGAHRRQGRRGRKSGAKRRTAQIVLGIPVTAREPRAINQLWVADITSLRQVVARRHPPADVVHHSDQGIQYACTDYVAELEAHGNDAEHEPAGESR
jgi:hypothetical protein